MRCGSKGSTKEARAEEEENANKLQPPHKLEGGSLATKAKAHVALDGELTTSVSHNMESSWAFLNSPLPRLEKHTYRFVQSSIHRSSI